MLAVDAGADMLLGHGAHIPKAVEVYKGKPVYYGLGSFSFHTGHFGGVAVGDWVGQMARVTLDAGRVTGASFQFVRHNAQNETVPCKIADEQNTLADIQKRSDPFGAKLSTQGDEVVIALT